MKLRMLLFPATIGLLVLYTNIDIARLLLHREEWSWPSTLAIFVIMIGPQILSRLSSWQCIKPLITMLIWLSSICMSLWTTFILFSMVVDSVYLLAQVVQFLLHSRSFISDTSLQSFFHHAFLGVLLISCLLVLFGFVEAINGPKVKHIRVPCSGLPSALNGIRIAQISDLHIGHTIQHDYIQNIVQKTMALKPDIIAVTGDIADGRPQELYAHTKPLLDLHAPLGIYYITGNHEYYSGAELWIEETKRLGFIPLINENRMVVYNGTKILIAGVTDLSAHQFLPHHRTDPYKAIASFETTEFKLLLAHQPESCFEAEKAGFDLQLSGHTHAGQFFPFNIVVKLAKGYYRGLYKHGKLWVYVNAGTGYWGATDRFAVPAEITLITLTA